MFSASRRGHEGIVRLLLDQNADVNKQAKDGNTALILGKKDYETSHYLKLLTSASMNGHEGIVKLLLEKNADVNKQDNDGETALSYGI